MKKKRKANVHPNSLANLKKAKLFQPGVSGNPKGKPPLLLGAVNAKLLAEGYTRVTASQLAEADELLLNLSQEKLLEVCNNKEMPMFMRITAKELLSGKGYYAVQDTRDRAYGKAAQEIKNTGNTSTTVINVGYTKPAS